jgi:hypothetical protein
MEEKFDAKLNIHGKIKTIGTNQILVSKETLVNLINQHVMNKYLNHDYADS